jgi:hypothetical protein
MLLSRKVAQLLAVRSGTLVAGLAMLSTSCLASPSGPTVSTRASALSGDASGGSGNLDLLFMIDNSSSMIEMQHKLGAEIPAFITALQALPSGLPSIHIAVVSSDLGAPGDSTSSIMCTLDGDQGIFQRGASTGVNNTPINGDAGGADAGGGGVIGCPGLNAGQTFVSNVDGVANYTGDLSTLVGCMTALGDKGCGFEHQLGSIARALGADGTPAPAQNAGFLRPDADLAIVVLSNEDDCSAPASTDLYSLNGDQQNITNPLGPIANYRCNEFGHLCRDPLSGQSCLIEPTLKPPADARLIPDSGASLDVTVNLTDCESNDTSSGKLTAVSSFISGIKALKTDPAHQIFVGAIVAPPTPYTVEWAPEEGGQNTQPGELWPQIMHSCGPAGADDVNPAATQTPTDGSFGDPAVRIVQWVKAFGANGSIGSICDTDYSTFVTDFVNKVGAHVQGGVSPVPVDAGTTSGFPVCPNAGQSTGLSDGCGGCAVATSGWGVFGLLSLGACLLLARRRGGAPRR